MNPKIDLTGKRFESLEVIRHYPRKMRGKGTFWLCRCECGNLLAVRSDNLRKGRSTRCSECNGNACRTSAFIKEVIEVDNQI